MKTEKLLLTLMVFSCLTVMGQRERNYIYLFDCTQSMMNQVNIWQPTKNYLRDDINKLDNNSTVTIIPFQNSAYPVIQFSKAKYSWNDIEKQLDEYITKPSGTNICSAWDNGIKFLNNNKDNYFMLLTDGNDTYDGMDNVCKRICNWCGNYKNSYAFYILLTPSARNPKLMAAINSCNTVFAVDANCHLRPFGAFTPNALHVSTLDLNKCRRLAFSASGEYKGHVVCNDPLFKVEVVGTIKSGRAIVKVSPKMSIQEITKKLAGKDIYTFDANITADKVKVLNPKISIEVSNKPERALNMPTDEIDLGDASYYKSFLFWKEKEQDTLTTDLKAEFNKAAIGAHSSISMRLSSSDGHKGYTVLLNGKPCNDSIITFSTGTSKSILSIIFDKNSETGKRYFKLLPVEGSVNQLERINDDPSGDYELTLRAHYAINMNPLLKIFLWAGIVLGVLLVIWFITIKPTFDRFKCHGISTTIGNNIYSKKLHGKRQLIVTNNKKLSQGLFNRLFLGEKAYIYDELVGGTITVEPKKESGMVRFDRKLFNLTPTDRKLSVGTEYQLKNLNDNNIIILTLK